MDIKPDQVEKPVDPAPNDAPKIAGDPPHFVHYESAYGTDQRLSFAVRVF